jgi:hypothetical protein
MIAVWVFAAATLVKVLSCMATDEPQVIAVNTPPAFPVSPYYNYWQNGTQYYNPTVFAPKPTLSIAFVNEGNSPIKSVEFGVFAGDTLVAKVRDSGHFAPGAEIKHELRLSGYVFPLPSGAVHCAALEASHELQHDPAEVAEQRSDVDQESRGAGAVDDAVVVAYADRKHQPRIE